jgi:hypothetical protein
MEQFPPNSKASRRGPAVPVERVTSADAVRRKPSLGKKFSQTFIGGDARTAWDYMIWEVAVPEIRYLMVESLQSGIERFFTGAVSRGRHPTGRNPLGHFNYQSRYQHGPQDDRGPVPTRRQLSSQARARHDFDEIILQTRVDAQEVLERMYDMLEQYEVVTVADLYGLVGLKPDHTDTTWGWTDLKGTTVGRVRGLGYLLDLPEPEALRR